MDKDKKLQEIFGNDPLGLLNIKPSNSPAQNEDGRLVASFMAINDFLVKNQRFFICINCYKLTSSAIIFNE